MRPKPSSPAERGEEHAAHQRQLKADAAARRKAAAENPDGGPRPKLLGASRPR
jgi:hypothetical protein